MSVNVALPVFVPRVGPQATGASAGMNSGPTASENRRMRMEMADGPAEGEAIGLKMKRENRIGGKEEEEETRRRRNPSRVSLLLYPVNQASLEQLPIVFG